MLEYIPNYINLLFTATLAATIIWFYIACKSKTFLFLIILWTILQSILAWNGVFQNIDSFPPKIMLFGPVPALVMMLICFLTKQGRDFIDNINLKTLTYFHTIRIPVEIVLLLLYYSDAVSVYMTFEGTNFDIISGASAALVAYLAFNSNSINKKLLLWWNIICLLLLINVVVTAIFAIPSPWQQLSLEQPNIAVLYFPFNLLPSVIVPLVLFGHLVAFRQLARR